METRVWHYDGRSGERRMPIIALTADQRHFVLEGDGADPGPYAFTDLKPHGTSHHERAFGLKGRPGWRITFLEFPPSEIAVQLPKQGRYGRWIDRFGLWRSVGVLAVLAALVVAVTLKLPPLIARLIPQSMEQRMGRLMVGNMGAYACTTPEGEAALKALAARLRQGDGITIRVVNAQMVNAVAFPGGQVVLFDGLIQNAQSPDEVAGVLAHELGHVAHRDGMESLVRQYGLSLLLGGFDSNISGYGNALLNARYSRKTEAGADGYAIGHLQAANVSPRPTAALFARLAKQDEQSGNAGLLLNYLSSHPLSSAREQRFAASAVKGAAYTPSLTPSQWQALRKMCADGPPAPTGINF
ncbi:M48 family metallopeptidase [Sphingomonas elodea]|uniref:M48 family metallopeptidase n=1 Tax=Sphingomonas elodea TaxID=179878 RepID=UPI0002630FDC|nr:M48 family metallopeptidase [Sphingomonas elodea]